MGNEFWSPGVTLDEMEKRIILKALKFYPNKTAAAEALGCTLRTINNKLERYEAEEAIDQEALEERRRKAEEHLLRARGLYREPEKVQDEAPAPAPFPQRTVLRKTK